MAGSELDARYIDIMESLSKLQEFTDEQVQKQRERTAKRLSMSQWLDENENEWAILDNMCRSRPWATNKDKPFRYPFREVTRAMREAGERFWIGDTEEVLADEARPSARGEAASEVLVNVLPTQEYPPHHRLLLFTPEFGAASSYSAQAWAELKPKGHVDVWTVCWQGWHEFDSMIKEVFRWVQAFADGVSTVWLGHSMGAIVMYECLKRMHKVQAPCLPVAAFVSGCPAPHLFKEAYRPVEAHPWLNRMRISYDFESLTAEETEALRRDFSVHMEDPEQEQVQSQLYYGIAPPPGRPAAGPPPRLRPLQRQAVMGDLRVMRSYEFRHHDDRKVLIPLVIFKSDEDPLVDEESVDAWAEYTTDVFQAVPLEDGEDSELLAAMGHGFARIPPKTMLKKVQEVAKTYQLNKDVDDDGMLPDIGPTDGPVPEDVDVVIVGAGITGVCQARAFAQQGMSLVLLEKSDSVGGIWKFYANVYSRVNTSEVGYRIVDQEGPTARPNQDHSPRHDIMRDIHTVCSKYAYGQVRCGWEVIKTEKQQDGTWIVTAKSVKGGELRRVRCRVVMFAVNRRIGRRRSVVFQDEASFRGDICYGYANELRHLKFWGKRVIVVGAGAFAFENLRTAVEHGAKHVTILGRRSGSTCPKWIDMIAFIRPTDEHYHTSKAGNMISFEAWQKCYQDAGLQTPECWDEGLLKPNSHTVSVSDLVYIAGFHGMADLRVGEIQRFRKDGHGVELKDGTSLDCDIVIKCTGFHLNEDVPKITGKTHMFPSGFIDLNMAYLAEPLLDGGQFGSSKGMQDSSELKSVGIEEVIRKNQHKLGGLPPHLAQQFVPRGNPFGSGYAGGLLSQGNFIAWFAANTEKQKQALQGVGQPRMDMVRYWSSHMHIGQLEEYKDLLAKACRDN